MLVGQFGLNLKGETNVGFTAKQSFFASASDAVNIGASVSRNGAGEWGETSTQTQCNYVKIRLVEGSRAVHASITLMARRVFYRNREEKNDCFAVCMWAGSSFI